MGEPPVRALPAETLRLFDGYDPNALAAPEARAFVIGRLLEEGESADLAWLGATVDRDALVDWMEHRADRQLSRRSRLFWRSVLALRPSRRSASPLPEDTAPPREALWPL
jgi:hypothetical protein